MSDGLTLRLDAEQFEQLVQAVVERVLEMLIGERESANGSKPSPYMTVDEAAEFLRCKRQRVDDLLSQRRLRRFKDGSRTLLSRAELESYVSEDRRGGGRSSAPIVIVARRERRAGAGSRRQ